MRDARQPTCVRRALQRSGSGALLSLETGRRCRQQPLQQLGVVSSLSLTRVALYGICSCQAGCPESERCPCRTLLVYQGAGLLERIAPTAAFCCMQQPMQGMHAKLVGCS